MSAALLEAVRQRVEELFAEEGAQAGSEFKQEPGARRLANLRWRTCWVRGSN